MAPPPVLVDEAKAVMPRVLPSLPPPPRPPQRFERSLPPPRPPAQPIVVVETKEVGPSTPKSPGRPPPERFVLEREAHQLTEEANNQMAAAQKWKLEATKERRLDRKDGGSTTKKPVKEEA